MIDVNYNNNDILEKLNIPPFKPLWPIQNGRLQTLGAVYFPYNPFLDHSLSHEIPLSDGDKIVVIENRPTQLRSSQRIALLVHGLTGSDRSKYLVRLTQQLVREGVHVFRMNLRGCGAGIGLSKKLYHSGRSEDTRTVIEWLKTRYPDQPVTQVGFSLGANITLKMAGENGSYQCGNLDSIVAISPPLDLHSTVKLITKRHNTLFNHYFMKGLRRDVKHLHRAFPELPFPKLSNVFNVYEFDDVYTAPRSGFKNALDYYTQCSSKLFVNKITLPTFIMYAKDDPVITRRAFLALDKKPNIDMLITPAGGHVGWIGKTEPRYGFRWMDQAIVKWINWFDTTH